MAYWQFLPAGLLAPVVFATQVDWLQVHPWRGMVNLSLLAILSVPVLNATSRRLNDSGADGTQAFYTFAPFVILWIGYQCILWGGYAIGILGGAWIFIVWFFALLILTPLHLVALVATVFIVANVIGQTLVPSDTSHNEHGPNPHEVNP